MATDGERATRQYIKPTDSEYVRLAKQGGDRDLLVCHEIVKSNEAKPYSKCDWFDHIHNAEEDARNRRTSNQVENSKLQSAKDQGKEAVLEARLEGCKIKEKYTRGGAPFHTDNMSFWERRKVAPGTPASGEGHQDTKPQDEKPTE